METRQRPQTPHDFTLLKSISYEEATKGTPPLPGRLVNSSRPSSSTKSLEQPNLSTPLSPISPPPPIATEFKRDSGIAPSLSTAGYASHANSKPTTPTVGAAEESRQPSIVQDEAPGGGGEIEEKEASKIQQFISELPTITKSVPQIESFKGIQSEIGSGTADGVDLADLISEKVAFSPRGSLLFSGKKMNKPLESQNDISTQATSVTETSGRALSAEEMTFSKRVRSMYDHGDERAADYVPAGRNSALGMRSVESIATDKSTANASADGIVVEKTRAPQTDENQAEPSPRPDTRASYTRKSNEFADSIEDWSDIDGQDVDRYGFINRKRISSRQSTSDRPTNEGLQRVATALRIESDKPRRSSKLLRKPSSAARFSASFPPASTGTDMDRVTSYHSSQPDTSPAKRPARNPFRSKEHRVLAEASDMLTLPPGLAESGQEDLGETASAYKRRERAREDKWQSMARIESQRKASTGKGGGMRFAFDTSDPKLVNRTWKGIPDRWRATAWHSFLSTSAKKRGIGASDDELVLQFHKLQEEGSADDVQIDMDVPRTINLHIMFRRRYRGGQRLLFRVLHAISLYFPETGYVQGMASLAATLLCYFEEERAFVMMVRLWQLRGLEQLFQSGFEGLMAALEEFERDWLKRGDVAQKLEELGITSTAYGTRWYLTLFNLSVPFPAQLRVWDVFMLLGDASSKENDTFGGAELDVLHATSAALIDAARDIILGSDFETAMKVLTSFVPVKDEDLFMRVAKTEWKLRKKRVAKT